MELTKRYTTYDYLKKKIPYSEKCVEKSTGNFYELFYYGNYIYKIKDLDILLLKKMGLESSSRSGTVYLSKLNNYKFVTKLMVLNNFSTTELEISQLLSDIAYKTKNIHLPLLYGHSICNDIKDLKLKLLGNEDEEDEIKENQHIYNPKNSYYCLFIELYQGSLGTLLKELFKTPSLYSNLKDIINNIIMQSFIGILTCHSNNIYHHDTRIDNFLFNFPRLNGNHLYNYTYEYSYKDLKFNLDSRLFTITICDFGLSEFIKDKNFKHDYFLFLDILEDEYLWKYKLMHIINLDLIFNLLDKSNNDYEFFKSLIENNFFDDYDDKSQKNEKIEINLNPISI
jgi:serine/threonine protein kinase